MAELAHATNREHRRVFSHMYIDFLHYTFMAISTHFMSISVAASSASKRRILSFLFQTGSCHPMERKSRRCWQYLFCFAEPDFTPRQGHQHSAFVTAELQQASLVCRGVVGEAVGALLGSAGGGGCGRLKSFHPLLALPCGHVHKAGTERRRVGWWMWIKMWKRLKVRDMEFKKCQKGKKQIILTSLNCGGNSFLHGLHRLVSCLTSLTY